MKFRSILIIFIFLAGAGCASGPKDELGPELRSLLGIDETLSEPPSEDLEKTFDANTLIKRAEHYYSKEEYVSAIGEYQRFLDLHPIHRLAPLARFRIALCYYHQIRTIDRDIEPIQKSLAVFENIVAEAPQSLYAQRSAPYIVELKERLAKREYYIGAFYYKKEAYPAAIARLDNLIKSYPNASSVPDALYYLGDSFHKTGQPEKAREYFTRLLEKNPDSPYRIRILQDYPGLAAVSLPTAR